MKVIGGNDRAYSLREEFITHFPRKTIEDLQLMEEDGYFICLANVEGILKNDSWWYQALFRIRLDVSDITERAHFVIFDHDAASLLSKTCASMVGDAMFPSLHYPDELDLLIGKELLFKVEVKDDRAFKFDDSFKVKKICSDEDIIREFKDDSSIKTPEESTFKPPMSVLPGEELPAEGGPSANIVIDLGGGLCDDGEEASISAGESSNVAPCVAPKKRKVGARVERPSVTKKRDLGSLLKLRRSSGY
ncbi:hypothetical protein SESBI_45989 [Sesbania bispinosa]|nr:hypothetical protein SESBI_45989 [Sesbania bispinosa]